MTKREDFQRRLDARNRPPGVLDEAAVEIVRYYGDHVELVYLDKDGFRVQSMWGVLTDERGLPAEIGADDLPDDGRRSGR